MERDSAAPNNNPVLPMELFGCIIDIAGMEEMDITYPKSSLEHCEPVRLFASHFYHFHVYIGPKSAELFLVTTLRDQKLVLRFWHEFASKEYALEYTTSLSKPLLFLRDATRQHGTVPFENLASLNVVYCDSFLSILPQILQDTKQLRSFSYRALPTDEITLLEQRFKILSPEVLVIDHSRLPDAITPCIYARSDLDYWHGHGASIPLASVVSTLDLSGLREDSQSIMEPWNRSFFSFLSAYPSCSYPEQLVFYIIVDENMTGPETGKTVMDVLANKKGSKYIRRLF